MNPIKDSRLYAEKGRSELVRKNFKRAVVDYSRGILSRNNHMYSLDGMGEALLEQEKYKEALLFFQKVVMVKPDNAVPHYNLALVLRILGKIDESLEEYKEAVHLDPNASIGLRNLANLLSARGRYEEAREYYLKVVKLTPSDAFLVANGIGCLDFFEGKFTKAKEGFQKSISLDGKFIHAYCNMSLVLFCEKNSEEALKYFEDGMKTLEDERSRLKTTREIATNYTDHKTRLEAKLTSNEILNEEEVAVLRIMIDGLTEMIDLLSQQQ